MGVTTVTYSKKQLKVQATCVMCGYSWKFNNRGQSMEWRAKWLDCPNCGNVIELENPHFDKIVEDKYK